MEALTIDPLGLRRVLKRVWVAEKEVTSAAKERAEKGRKDIAAAEAAPILRGLMSGLKSGLSNTMAFR